MASDIVLVCWYLLMPSLLVLPDDAMVAMGDTAVSIPNHRIPGTEGMERDLRSDDD
jgi:hypothetical protein